MTTGSGEPSPRSSSRVALIAAIAVILVLLGVGAAFLFTRRGTVEERSTAGTPPVTATSVTAQPQPAQSTVEVATAITATTSTQSTTVVPPATTATATHSRPQPKQAETPRAETPEPPKKASAEPALPLLKYGDGRGETGGNEAALQQLREQLAGVKTIALRGGEADLLSQLQASLKDRVTIASDAEVTVDFNGKLERLGRGRKRRSATVTISKHGHAFFQYELPPEEYRVGDNPAEAFARVLKDALP